MARMRQQSRQTTANISKFLGLYEAEDGDTQLKEGAAALMENFRVTENYHIRTRPGMATRLYTRSKVRGMWTGYINGVIWEMVVAGSLLYLFDETGVQKSTADIEAGTDPVCLFDFGDMVYLLTGSKYYFITVNNEALSVGVVGDRTAYVPLVVTGAAPSGGGTTLERINRLTNRRRVQYSADGTTKVYVLPEAGTATRVTVNGQQLAGGTTSEAGKVTFDTAPAAGTNNVEIEYSYGTNEVAELAKCRYAEMYNGATDSRVFLYGDGTNVCYYSGVTESGKPSALYFPAMNEIAVADSNTPITGMVRHYSRLMVFKPDGAFAIRYDTLTLADGSTTAGFYIAPMHRELGSEAMGQAVTVQNFARTFCAGSLYDWKQTSSYYQDERYARVCSEAVQFTLQDADPDKIFLFDDDKEHTFYCFLNDEAGTVLLNAYELGVWYKYTGFFDVHAMMRTAAGRLLFGSSTNVLELSDRYSYDYIQTGPAAGAADQTAKTYERRPIKSKWESGHMAFGSECTRKYSSVLWVTLKPSLGADMHISARTDRRATYAEKLVAANLFGGFGYVDFRAFSFETYSAPKVRRIKLKVKKFVYYKLLLHANLDETATTVTELPSDDREKGGRVTVLNIDQRVRYTGDAK